MTTQTTTIGKADKARLERELLARLGLTSDASAQDIETAHDDLLSFLETAPGDLRAWTQREIAFVDEAYALLSDPTADLSAVAATSLAASPAADATVPAAAAPLPGPSSDEAYLEELGIDTAAYPSRPQREARANVLSAPAGAARVPPRRNRLLVRAGIAVAAIVGAVAITVVVYNAGATSVPGFTGTPAPEASAAAAQIDQARVAALMQNITADPKDVTSLQDLGDIYFAAGDYSTAGGWMEKILEVDPKNLTARLALGAAAFNLGNSADAEKQWRQVIELDPENVEAHYDLGFMYLSQDPPDMTNVKAEWTRVIEIAPDSDLAKNVQQHLASFESAVPSDDAPPAASPAASPAGSPAASPAASPSPSGN
jgi:tetratricopeptide (TPR) repeat protein